MSEDMTGDEACGLPEGERCISFRSSLDFRRDSWLRSEQHFYAGMYKTAQNTGYDIRWSTELCFTFKDKSDTLQISPSSWSLPFELDLEYAFFKGARTDDALSVRLQKFMLHLISCIEHIYLQVDVMGFKLDGRPILVRQPGAEEWRFLRYRKLVVDMGEIFEEYALLNDTGHFDCVCAEAAAVGGLELSWQLLVEAVANFEVGRYRSSVICANSAVEVEVGPALTLWLTEQMLEGENAKEAVIDLNAPARLSLFLQSAKRDAARILSKSQRIDMLKSLKWLNALRNRVVHEGADVRPDEAQRAVRSAGVLLRVLWVHKRSEFFKQALHADLFEDSKAALRRLKLD